VTTKMREQGAVVFVVFGNANATKAQWAALTAKPEAAGAQGPKDMKTLMAEVPPRTLRFSRSYRCNWSGTGFGKPRPRQRAIWLLPAPPIRRFAWPWDGNGGHSRQPDGFG